MRFARLKKDLGLLLFNSRFLHEITVESGLAASTMYALVYA